jgi:hypothetical protein
MADVDTYHRMTLKLTTYYARKGKDQVWSCKFSLSGAAITDPTVAETVALGLFGPIQALTSARTSLTGWLYYNAGSNVNTYQLQYPVGTHQGNGDAYGGTVEPAQLEVVGLCRAPVKINTKGRQTYLFKHVHDIGASNTAQGELAAIESEATLFQPWNDGVGPDNLVPIDPSTGQIPTAPWSIASALYTRQLRGKYTGKA